MFKKLKQRVEFAAKQATEFIAQGTSTSVGSLQWVPTVEEFEQAWYKVESEHQRVVELCRSNPQVVESALRQSRVQSHLRDLANILLTEDMSSRREFLQANDTPAAASMISFATGPLKPCLASMLENRVWEKLCTLGLTDEPKGMKVLVLRTTRYILRHIRHPLLPYKTAHEHLCRLIKVCAVTQDEAVQTALVELLNVVWTKLGEDPSQITFFVEPYDSSHKKSDMPDVAEKLGSLENQNCEYAAHGFPFLIVDSLLPFVHWENAVGKRARESVLIIVGIGNKHLSLYLAHNTNLCNGVARTIASDFLDLLAKDGPQTITSQESLYGALRFCNALAMAGTTVAETVVHQTNLDSHCKPAIHHDFESNNVRSARKTGDWGDSSAVAAKHFTTHLLHCVSDTFLERVLGPLLLGPAHEEAVQWTYHLCAAIECIGSIDMQVESPLLWKITEFLIGSSDELGWPPHEHLIRDTLLQRISNSSMEGCSVELSAATLTLFLTLLSLDDPRILDALVMVYLPAPNLFEPGQCPKKSSEDELHPNFPVCHEFLAQFPGVPTWNAGSRDRLSLEEYYTDAERNVATRSATYLSRSRKLADVSSKRSTDRKELPFPGPFLSAILSKVKTLLENDIKENMAITGIIAVLAQCPYPVLHAFLFNCCLSKAQYARVVEGEAVSVSLEYIEVQDTEEVMKLKSNSETVMSILENLWDEATRMLSDPPTQTHFVVVRDDLRRDGPCATINCPDSDIVEAELVSLKAIVVLEEFLKELGCIRQAQVSLESLLTGLSNNGETESSCCEVDVVRVSTD